jgi:hypothetical protein
VTALANPAGAARRTGTLRVCAVCGASFKVPRGVLVVGAYLRCCSPECVERSKTEAHR